MAPPSKNPYKCGLAKALLNGQLAIAKLGERYELVPYPVANKIIERDSSFIISQAQLCQPG